MKSQRLTLLAALLVSLALHALVVGSSEFAIADYFAAADEVLASKQVTHVQRVRLATRGSPPPPMPKPRKAPKMSARVAAAKPAKVEQPEVEKSGEVAAADVDASSTEQPADTPAPPTPADDTPPPAPVAAPAEQPAPAFPVQLQAVLDARLNSIPATLTQTWNMEGYRYAIQLTGSKFGFDALLQSDGRIDPVGGLAPESSQLTLGKKVRSFTRYADGVVHYGKPGNPHEAPLPVVPQDFASLPIHLAVTFDGRPQSIFVSTGRGLYQVRFTVEAEEMLKLPIGQLRTLHLAGEFFEPDLGTMVRGFDIWLAPDYLNFPVKVSGHLRSGDPVEWRVRSLEIEGKLVLGKKSGAEVAAAGEEVPEWLKQRLHPETTTP